MIAFVAVAQAADTTQNLFGSIDWSKPTWDLFIIIFFVVSVFLYGLSLGRERIIAIVISIYMALAVVTNAPFLRDPLVQEQINDKLESLFVFRISAFIFVFIILFFMLSRSAIMRNLSLSEEKGSWLQVFLFSFLHVGLVISIVLSFLPAASLEGLSLFTRQVFTSDIGRFAWIVGPILAMVLFKPKKDKKFKYDV